MSKANRGRAGKVNRLGCLSVEGVDGVKRRVIVALMAGATIVAGLVAPAIGAGDHARRGASASLEKLGGIAGFTPAAIDPKLTALLSKGQLDVRDLHFTPGEARRTVERAPSLTGRLNDRRALVTTPAAGAVPAQAPVGALEKLAPIQYNLGGSVGWKQFALPAEVTATKVEALPLGNQTSFDLAQTKGATHAGGKLRAIAQLPVSPSHVANESLAPQVFDVAGAYRLAPNLDITAGVRYRNDSFRLDRPSDERRDSRAVYIGTALHF